MKILIEPGSYTCRNLGDVAMLEVAVRRIRKLRPEASLAVVTRNPELLRRYLPEVKAVPEAERNIWLEGRSLLGRYGERLPAGLRKLEKEMWHKAPGLVKRGVKWKNALLRTSGTGKPTAFLEELLGSDLLMVSGMGAWTDAFASYALGVWDEFEFAQRRGIMTAAVGQGVGPIEAPELWARARTVLPRLVLIGVREQRTGPDLLRQMGVPESRIGVTGDDAIELAHEKRQPDLGDGIGLNLRVSYYSDTDSGLIEEVGGVLCRLAVSLGAPLIPAPISLNEPNSDAETIRKAAGRGHELLAGAMEPAGTAELIEQIGRCRVMVTGSYHAAVFALSQGIPAVCLAKSDYYAGKFLGLQAQFGAGCSVLTGGPALGDRLAAEIRSAWDGAAAVRPGLLVRAAQQIEAGYAAYDRLFRSVI